MQVEYRVLSPENMDMNETCSRVLGKDIIMPMIIAMTEKSTVHKE
jgi:hypothetical protein